MFWHADYAEHADCSCICGISESCVENMWVMARRLRRIHRLFLYLRNQRDLRGKYRGLWHADYAEYADFYCICGICEICVEYVGCFGTKITQNTQIVIVSAESARSAWNICGVLARRLRRIRRFLLYLRNLLNLRGKYRGLWHADYAEHADCSCFCGIS